MPDDAIGTGDRRANGRRGARVPWRSRQMSGSATRTSCMCPVTTRRAFR